MKRDLDKRDEAEAAKRGQGGETWAVDLTAAQFGEGPCCWFV